MQLSLRIQHNMWRLRLGTCRFRLSPKLRRWCLSALLLTLWRHPMRLVTCIRTIRVITMAMRRRRSGRSARARRNAPLVPLRRPSCRNLQVVILQSRLQVIRVVRRPRRRRRNRTSRRSFTASRARRASRRNSNTTCI